MIEKRGDSLNNNIEARPGFQPPLDVRLDAGKPQQKNVSESDVDLYSKDDEIVREIDKIKQLYKAEDASGFKQEAFKKVKGVGSLQDRRRRLKGAGSALEKASWWIDDHVGPALDKTMDTIGLGWLLGSKSIIFGKMKKTEVGYENVEEIEEREE